MIRWKVNAIGAGSSPDREKKGTPQQATGNRRDETVYVGASHILLHPTILRCDYSFFCFPLYASRLTIPSFVRFRLARVRGYGRTENMLRRRGSGIQGTLILLCGQVRTHLLDIGLEGIGHREWRVASKLKNGPVDHVVGKPPVLGGVKRRIL